MHWSHQANASDKSPLFSSIHTINQISDRIKLNGYFFFHTPMLLSFYELERNPQHDSDYPQTNLLFHRLDLFFTLLQAESLQSGTNVNLINRIKRHSKKERTTNRNARQSVTDCGIYLSAVLRRQKAWDSVPQRAGSFPRLAISSCYAQEAFRGLQFRPATRRKLSRLAIPSCYAQEAFAACDSVLQCAGSFPRLAIPSRSAQEGIASYLTVLA